MGLIEERSDLFPLGKESFQLNMAFNPHALGSQDQPGDVIGPGALCLG